VKDRDPSLYLTHVLESIELVRAYVRTTSAKRRSPHDSD